MICLYDILMIPEEKKTTTPYSICSQFCSGEKVGLRSTLENMISDDFSVSSQLHRIS